MNGAYDHGSEIQYHRASLHYSKMLKNLKKKHPWINYAVAQNGADYGHDGKCGDQARERPLVDTCFEDGPLHHSETPHQSGCG